MVAACRGDFEGGAGGVLARDVDEVEVRVARPGGQAGAGSGAGDDEPGEHGVGAALFGGFFFGYGFVGEDGDELAQAAHAEDGDAGDQGRFCGGLFGDDDLFVARFGGGETAGRMPRTGRTRPSRPSSPIMTRSVSSRGSMRSAAPRIAQAMARSKPVPLLGTEAGLSPTVSFFWGQASPELTTAARTRSRLSRGSCRGGRRG